MFQLPQKVKNEINNFRNSLTDLLQGKISSARFTGVRVPWGIYSHRGGKVFMTRIRIAGGEMTAEQIRAIAKAALSYGSGLVHITTRQDMQIHDVKLEDTIHIIEGLEKFELSPRGGGGNTVRSITTCPRSGVCADEYFDVRENAIALTEFLLQDDASFNMPRKFKIGFSGCAKDCTGCLVQDVGFIARTENGQKGFQVFVGGGMGAQSALGHELEPFLPVKDLGYCVLAIRTIFYQKGDRKNKHHNRLRFLIADNGFATFKTWYEQEKKKLVETEYIQLRTLSFSSTENVGEDFSAVADQQFREFFAENVLVQKQKGLISVEVRIPRGDISAEKLNNFADLLDHFPGTQLRLSQNQNLLVVNIRKKDSFEVFEQLRQFWPAYAHPNSLSDVVCCKGAQTCNLGLCNSPGLSEELERILAEQFAGTLAFKKINIKINGCPNSCGQHPLGMISFHGLVRRVHGRPAPFYKLLLGGRKAADKTRLAKDTEIVLPAKNVPAFLVDFLKNISQEIAETTDVEEYLYERGPAKATEIASLYTFMPSYEENREFYIDWGKTEEFSLSGLGPGECGAGILDMINADLTEAKTYLDATTISAADLKKAFYYTSRALLIVKGVDPRSEEEALRSFVNTFVQTGIAEEKYADLPMKFSVLNKDVDSSVLSEIVQYAKEFYHHIQELYKSMDSAFNFSKSSPSAPVKAEGTEKAVLDLKGVACPMNYVKAKLFLENRQLGETIVLYLDEGEPIQNVPRSLENDGQKILRIEKKDSFYVVEVRKDKT